MNDSKTAGKDLSGIKNKAAFALVFIYAAAVFAMNLIRIFDNEFWSDEVYSIMLSRMHLFDMISETASDVHPPLYYLFLMMLRNMLGDHGWVYHLAALIPFAFVLVFILTAVYKRFGFGSALIMITLCGLSENALNYNIEVRMYSLAFMFVLFSFYELLRVLEGKKNASALFILFSLGAAYSHYYALISVAFFYVAILINVIRKKLELKKLYVIYGVTVIGYLPWLVKAVVTLLRTKNDFWMKEIPGIRDLIKYFYLTDNKWYSYAMFVLTFALAAYVIIRGRREKAAGVSDKGADAVGSMETDAAGAGLEKNSSGVSIDSVSVWLICGLSSAVFTCVIGEAVSYIVRPVFTFRFIYPVVSVMWMVLAASVSFLKKKEIAGIVVAAVSLVFFLPGYRFIYTYDRITDKLCLETMEQVSQAIEPGDVLITNDSHMDWMLLDYYVPGHEHEYTEDLDISFDENNSYVLVWSDVLSGDEINILSEKGYEAEPEIIDGLLGDRVNIYRLS
ncbi:MAG: glycosyltransferase family 39 protein [Lachnospiraceae bacterium]|nr:glycosyltransferase family 39 protein [Lachnospiraceae bacterium]